MTDTKIGTLAMNAAIKIDNLYSDPDVPPVAVAEVIEDVTRLQSRLDRLRLAEAALDKINAVRNDIVGRQSINWSAHIYPLVAALDEAGFEGEEYEVANEKATTADNRIAALVEMLETAMTWADRACSAEDYRHRNCLDDWKSTCKELDGEKRQAQELIDHVMGR